MSKKIDIKNLSREEIEKKLELVKELKRRKREARTSYVPNEGQILVHKSEKPIRAVFSGNGCWAKGTEFRMFDGSVKAVEDIKIGDQLMGPDSTPRTILKLYQGQEDLYQITPKFRAPKIVNASHTLSLYQWKTENVNHAKKVYKEIPVKDFVKLGPKTKRKSYLWSPKEGIEYPESSVPLDPYFLGAWLGDRHSETCAITTLDSEIRGAIYEQALVANSDVRVVEQHNNKAESYFIKTDLGKPNPTQQILRELNLINNKHIPNSYLINAKDVRLKVLAGIIDTDGHLANGQYYKVIQKRENLAKDIKTLAESLGFSVSWRVKTINNTEYYQLSIRGNLQRIPVKLPHKKRCPELKLQRDWSHEPFKIEYVGEGQFYGFQVDKDNLVLHADYQVDRNSGKTTLAVHEAMWRALGYNPVLKKTTPVPAKVIVVYDTPDKIQDVFVPEASKWFNLDRYALNKKGRHHITEMLFPNGSEIQFVSHQQDSMRFESIELDMVVADEPIPRHIWIALQRGGRKKGRTASYLFVGTPISGQWLQEEIYKPWVNNERDDIECFTYGTKVNEKNLSENYIETFGKSLTEKEKRVRFHGEFFNLDGLALGHLFDRHTHIISKEECPDIVLAAVSIDPHASKNHTACVVGVDRDGQFYYLDELSSKVPPREFARQLKKMYQPYPIFDIICDSLGASPMTGGDGNKSFIEVLNEEGVRARATTYADKSDEAWIMKIQEVLTLPENPDNFGRRTPRLRVVDGNPGIIKDIETVSWTKIRNEDAYKPKLDIRNKDYLACLKYALATNLSPIKKKSAKGYVRNKMPTTYGKLRRRLKFKV